MRLLAAAFAAAVTIVPPGDRATATYSGRTLSLTLHYLMTCGQPGRGPVVVRLPGSWRVSHLRATVRGRRRPATRAGSVVTIALPTPPQVTCMSIAEGALPLTVAAVAARRGTFVVRATVGSHSFAPRVRVP